MVLRNHNIEVRATLRADVAGVFDGLADWLKTTTTTSTKGQRNLGSDVGAQLGSAALNKSLQGVNDEFAQVQQCIRLSSKLVAIQLDKLDLDLNTLKNSLKYIEKSANISYPANKLDEPSQLSLGREAPYIRGSPNRSRSQIREQRTAPAISDKMLDIQRELGKLGNEIKKKDEKIRQYEELFFRKDTVAHTMVKAAKAVREAADKQSEDTVRQVFEVSGTKEQAYVELIQRKDETIARLQREMAIKEQESRIVTTPSSRLLARHSEESRPMLEKLCTEVNKFLGTLERLKRAVSRRDDANVEQVKQDFENQKQILKELTTAVRRKSPLDVAFGQYKVERQMKQTENQVAELRDDKRELENLYAKQSEDVLKYQQSILEYIDKVKSQTKDIENLQHQMLSYQRTISNLQEQLASATATSKSQVTLKQQPRENLSHSPAPAPSPASALIASLCSIPKPRSRIEALVKEMARAIQRQTAQLNDQCQAKVDSLVEGLGKVHSRT